MRKLALCIVLLLPFVYIYSQELDYYYLEIKEGYELGEIQKTVNADQTLTLAMENTALAAALNEKPVYTFERAFLYNLNPVLDRIYLVALSAGVSLNEFLSREEIERIEQVFFNEQLTADVGSFTILPNDYDDVRTGGRNTALDLIRVPLAWTITRGEGQVMGWSDAKIYDHEDLVGKVIFELNTPPYSGQGDLQFTHGAFTSGMAAANTNNNIGIASVAPKAMIASSPNTGLSRIETLVQAVPGIRAINASWGGCSSPTLGFHAINELKYQDLLDQGYLVVAAAGNGQCAENTLFYPASYDATIAVTSVGHRVAPTYFHDIVNDSDNTPPGHYRSWKNVYLFRPDVSSTAGHNLRANIDITAPGHLLTGTRIDISTDPWSSIYTTSTATSPTAPFVTGVAALVFAANPNLTAQQVKDIILNTADDIYHIPWNQPFIGQLGSGRVNAYRAVLTAKCMDDPNYIGNLDLMVRNSMVDYGVEPDINTGNVMWNSQEIWVRHNAGESYIDVHQNPEYNPGNPNYVYVRVTNRSCVTSSGNEELTLYWAKANTSLNWPQNWDGSLTMGDITGTSSEAPTGGVVGTLNIPSLQPGQEAIVEFEWDVPNPQDYFINENPWHFCLLARIDTPSDPMTFPEGTFITANVKNNNNIAWKNMTVVNATPTGTSTIKPGGAVLIGNTTGENTEQYSFELFTNEINSPVFDEAEVLITLSESAYTRWVEGGGMSENIEVFNEEARQLLITGNDAQLLNMQYGPGEWDTLYLSFNFLIEEVTGKSSFEFHLIQKDAEGEAVGGEVYQIVRDPERPHFDAEGDSYENTDDETVLLATDIGEPALYNWYTPEGKLLHSGKEYVFVPDMPGDYLLEVIAEADGHKNYFKLTLSANTAQDQIVSLSPNPATNTVTVQYQVSHSAGSASLKIASFFGSTSNNYAVDLNETNLNVNLAGYPPGHYAVILTVDGQAVHAKQLVIN